MTHHIAILPGDGIGPEIISQAVRVLDRLIADGLDASYQYAPLGGAAYDQYGAPYPEATQTLCRNADAVLLGAVGGPQYDNLERPLRPERGLLAIRKDLNLFANLRPAILYKELANASTLKPEVVAGLDILIVRELTGDIYFGEPRGIGTKAAGERDSEVPHGGRRVVDNGGCGGAKGRELKVQRGGDQAKGHLQRKAGDGFDGNLAVERGNAVCHGKNRAHERADEHGAHDGDVRIDIEANTCD